MLGIKYYIVFHGQIKFCRVYIKTGFYNVIYSPIVPYTLSEENYTDKHDYRYR